ncbi:MAG: TrmH family RNA methyltransferase, partial [Spirulinaceae cyanobacterium]
IKQLRKLRQTKGRREQGLLLLEGTNLIEAAVQRGYGLESFCYTESWQHRQLPLWEQATTQAQRAELVSPEVLAAIATTVNPDGAIATLTQDQLVSRPPETVSLGLAIDRLQDPGNLGTIIRTAAAAAADGIWLGPQSVDVQNPKVLRASAGAWFQTPLVSDVDLEGAIGQWQQQGIQVIATTAQAVKNYWQIDWRRPSLILLGNERAGLAAELLAAADYQVCIPQAKTVESLNLGVSAALLLYEALRQRQKNLSR